MWDDLLHDGQAEHVTKTDAELGRDSWIYSYWEVESSAATSWRSLQAYTIQLAILYHLLEHV